MPRPASTPASDTNLGAETQALATTDSTLALLELALDIRAGVAARAAAVRQTWLNSRARTVETP